MGQRSIRSFGWRGAGLLCCALAGCAELSRIAAPPVRQRPARNSGTAPPSRPPRSSGAAPAIVLGSASGAPGQAVSFSATLWTGGANVAGAQNDVAFDAVNAPVAATSAGKPQCTPNRAIGKDATAFAFRPSKCSGSKCTGLRALVLSLSDVRPIADGAVLYTCTVRIAPSAKPGSYPLAISAVTLSTPDGREVAGATGVAGTITVSAKR